MNWIDNARVLSVFAVVCLHVAASIVVGVANVHSTQWWVGNLFDAATRWCVPVLVMASGALLLDSGRNERILVFFQKRASRILVPLMFWSAFYLCWRLLKGWKNGAPPTASELGVSILLGAPYFHLWYLFMIAGLYLVTPPLRLLLRRVTYRTLWWMVATLFFANGTRSVATVLLQHDLRLPLHWFVSYLPYFIAGHLIAIAPSQPPKWKIYLMALAAIGFTAAGCYIGSTTLDLQRGLYFYNSLSITVIPMSLCVMLLLKQNPPLLPQQMTRCLGELSLGIYLTHPALLEILEYLGIAARNYPTILSIPAITLLAYSAAALLSWLISQVPVLRRTV